MAAKRKGRDAKLSRTAHMAAARRVAALAGHSGDVDAARRALVDPHPEVRVTALRALSRLGDVTRPVVSTAAADEDPLVRAAAGEIALDLPARDAVALLGPLLEDEDMSVVEAAAFSAGELGRAATALVPKVSALMDHADTIVRETAVAALGAIGDRAALPVILAATRDRATVRRRAIIALAPFDGPDVDNALTAALADRDWQVRQAAEDQTETPEETAT